MERKVRDGSLFAALRRRGGRGEVRDGRREKEIRPSDNRALSRIIRRLIVGSALTDNRIRKRNLARREPESGLLTEFSENCDRRGASLLGR